MNKIVMAILIGLGVIILGLGASVCTLHAKYAERTDEVITLIGNYNYTIGTKVNMNQK